MALKRKGIVAVPGEYKYGDMTEIKTAEELKAAADRQPIIMLTRGHPVDGMPSAKDVIGTLSQKWSENRQRVEGTFRFHEEKIPEDIREQVANFEPLAISPGFMIDGIEDGVQTGIVYTHMAILDEEDPRCPLTDCGVNLRMDSKEGVRLYRMDQKSELEEAPEEPPPVEEEAGAPPQEEPAPEETEPEPEKPAEQEPEEVESEDSQAVEEIPREPEVVIPTSQPKSSKLPEGMQFVNGRYEYVPRPYRKKED
jgi:hypothetical protein